MPHLFHGPMSELSIFKVFCYVVSAKHVNDPMDYSRANIYKVHVNIRIAQAV